jgi:hypothetical protein
MIKDAASAGFYNGANGKMKVPRVQLLTIEGLLLLSHTLRAEHPDYEPDLNFKKSSSETAGRQGTLEL